MSQITFQGLAWNSRVRKVRSSYFVLIPKPIALGNFLQKGDELQQFITKFNDKTALITILDNKQVAEIETIKVERNTSIIKKIE